MGEKPTLRIVCAACRDPKTGTIFCSSRHYSEAMHSQIVAANMQKRTGDFEQGFVDQFDNFYTRKQAMNIALLAGQKIEFAAQGGITDYLMSEGLY